MTSLVDVSQADIQCAEDILGVRDLHLETLEDRAKLAVAYAARHRLTAEQANAAEIARRDALLRSMLNAPWSHHIPEEVRGEMDALLNKGDASHEG